MTSFQRRVAARTELELIATFGGAQLVRDMSGKFEPRGGTSDDRERANWWIKTFLTHASNAQAPTVRGL